MTWILVAAVVCSVLGSSGLQLAVERAHCPQVSEQRCKVSHEAAGEHFYSVNGKSLVMEFVDGDYLLLWCNDEAAVSLDDPDLPRFERTVRVRRLILTACEPPRRPFVSLLRALNVSNALERLALQLLPSTTLRTSSFQDLPHLQELAAAAAMSANVTAESTLLAHSTSLLELRLVDVTLERPLDPLPSSLRALSLQRSGLDSVPSAWLPNLRSLRVLVLREPELRDALPLEDADALLEISLRAPVPHLACAPHLENATLWEPRGLELRGPCGGLRQLQVASARVAELPRGWLAPAPQLRTLSLQDTPLRSLPPQLLLGAPDLRSLTLRSCRLSSLPADLLASSAHLQELDLSYNRLETLPPGIFSGAAALRSLRLNNNALHATHAAGIFSLMGLRELSLDRNPVGDLCSGPADLSPLWQMASLQSLSLAASGLTRVCADWRRDLRELTHLDLTWNNISSLQYLDMQWTREKATEVDLTHNPLRHLDYTRDDYMAALEQAPSVQRTVLAMDESLECDCRVYWAARAVAARPSHCPLAPLRCDGGPALAELEPSQLECGLPSSQCAPRCRCSFRPHLKGAVLDCGAVASRDGALPRRPAAAKDALAVLRAPSANISSLSPADLPAQLTEVDLRNNSLSLLDAATSARLLNPPRVVLLEGNPLQCDCESAPMLAALQTHSAKVDYDRLRCATGALVKEVVVGELCSAAFPLAAAIALLAAAAVGVALAALLVRPAARARLKAWLGAHHSPEAGATAGLEGEGEEEAALPYDAFVSFAHADVEEARAVVAQLESAGRRVCVHYRDWAPGEWIPRQIAHSVQASRRTVVLLSERFLLSQWALQEMRAAHAASLGGRGARLVLVLLDVAPEDARLEPQLRDYLALNTYLLRSDRWFWPKLLRAVPPQPPQPRQPPDQKGEPPPPASDLCTSACA